MILSKFGKFLVMGKIKVLKFYLKSVREEELISYSSLPPEGNRGAFARFLPTSARTHD